MENTAHQGWSSLSTPTPIITFSPVWTQGRQWYPSFGDRHSLLLLRRMMQKRVSFPRAYAGFRASGSREENELGEGRAFFRWLQKHDLGIEWSEKDVTPHPLFGDARAPRHDPRDEMARGLSFAIRPVEVQGRKIKLYVNDADMLGLFRMSYGEEVDFMELVSRYVQHRFKWESWRAPAPTFFDWTVSHGKRPMFKPGHIGLELERMIGLHKSTSF